MVLYHCHVVVVEYTDIQQEIQRVCSELKETDENSLIIIFSTSFELLTQ
jgi:PII-like signaling protein